LKIDVTGLKAPVDWLRRFADRFGAEIEVDGKLGNFFLTANAAHVPNQVKIIPGKKPGYVTVSQFNQPFSSDRRAALIVAIDILKYRAVLDELVVKREDILDEFAPAPRLSD